MITYTQIKQWQQELDAARDILSVGEQEVHATLSKLSDEMSDALVELVTEADPTAPFDMGAFANDMLARFNRPMGVLT